MVKKYVVINKENATRFTSLYVCIYKLVERLNNLGYNRKIYRFLCDLYHYLKNVNDDTLDFKVFYQRLAYMYVDGRYKQLFINFFKIMFPWKTYNSDFFMLVLAPNYKIN